MSMRSSFLFCSENGSWLSFSLKSVNSEPWMVMGATPSVRGRVGFHPVGTNARRDDAVGAMVPGTDKGRPREVPDELLRTGEGGGERPRGQGRRRDVQRGDQRSRHRRRPG